MLEWEFEWLPHAKKLQRAVDRGAKIPALERRPRVSGYLIQYWNAYKELQLTRRGPVGARELPPPIQYAEILAYAQLHGWEGEDAADLTYFVRVLESHLIYLHADKLEKTSHGPASRRN